MGLLSELMSAADSSKKYMKGLFRNPSDTLHSWADRNIQAYTKPNTSEMVGNYLGAGVSAPIGALGMTVWHGSPHKFDKFDMSKIGTGEGAQAYGHGLYMAEAPAVASEYRNKLSPSVQINAKNIDSAYKHAAKSFKEYGSSFDDAISGMRQAYKNAKPDDLEAAVREVFDVPYGQLYKVDIPDEAVARFLDWDKPLSEQANDVMAALKANKNYEEYWLPGAERIAERRGQNAGGDDLIRYLSDDFSPDEISEILHKHGIPGIRYLDGGSRGAGNGTSNFVLFDDALPRILERNGQATGLQPWKPGEWRGLLGD